MYAFWFIWCLAGVFLGGCSGSCVTRNGQRLSLTVFSVAAIVALILGVIVSRFVDVARIHGFYLNLPKDVLLFSGEIGCLISLCPGIVPWRKFTDAQLVLLTGFSAGLAYIIACSWVDYTAAVLPSLAVFLTYAIYRLDGFTRTALMSICVLVIFSVFPDSDGCSLWLGRVGRANVRRPADGFRSPELAGSSHPRSPLPSSTASRGTS